MPDEPWTYSIRQGGLMRCCLESIDLAMKERWDAGDGPPQEGDTLQCRYGDSHGGMIFHDGAWEWDRA